VSWFLWIEEDLAPAGQPIIGKRMTGIWKNVLPLRPNLKHPSYLR
jgi:hypothetical protein